MATQQTTSGLQALAAMFEQARREDRAAFLPYYPIGYPSLADSLDAIEAMATAGADGFEIGMPFSDPIADGPTIQAATQVALENGVTVQGCLAAVRELRGRGIEQPMLLMGYLNPVLAYGVEAFCTDAAAAGADGLIVPDLPPEEAGEVAAACQAAGLALIFFLAPTSDAARIQVVTEQASGFIYVVTLTGVTGARETLPASLRAFIDRIRQSTDQPLVAGFGISTPEHAAAMNGLVDGFIVGSALVRAGAKGPGVVGQLAAELRAAIDV
jgi:tryptophan synthase alpha chain